METKNQANEPVAQVKLGRIVGAIWRNESDNSVVRFNTTFSRLYKDGQDWKRTDSFGRDDLLLLSKVADLAHTRVFELEQEERSGKADQ